MIDAPERIWAWTWNTPAIKSHKTKCWCDYEPVFKDWVLRGLPSKKHWFGALTVYNQAATEYTRADIHDRVCAEWAEASQNNYQIAKDAAAESDAMRAALQQVLHHCRNTGRGSEMVDARIIERCEDTAVAALAALP